MLANDFWKQSLQINHLNPPEGGISHSVHTVIDAMPTIRKLSSGSYNVQIRRNGVPPISKTFKTKNDALAWARKTETDLDRGLFVDTRIAERITLDEVIDRYIDEILPSKKAIKSVKSYSKHVKKALGKYSLNRLTAAMISEYRDLRLKDNVYSNQTVVHELNLISRVLNACMKDWNIQLPNGNVVKNVRYPKLPNGRNRRITKSEECILCQELPTKILPLFKLALETGMRRGELVNIEWKHVDLDNRTLFIPLTKTDIPRTIPLSPTALKVFESVRLKGEGKVFNIGAEWITKSFAMTCHKIGIEDLHWHDLRHEAITRLFEKGLNVMEVSAISGHQDLRMLKRYVHLDASILARKLADKDKGD